MYSCVWHGKTSYAGNFALGEVRKIRSVKLHYPPYTFSFQYGLVIVSTSLFHGRSRCLKPFDCWDRGFESRLGHGCSPVVCCIRRGLCDGLVTRPVVRRIPTVCVCVCVCVYVGNTVWNKTDQDMHCALGCQDWWRKGFEIPSRQ